MNQDDKRKYMKEWYRKNADRLKKEQRERYRAKKEGLSKPMEEPDCCGYCKRFSSSNFKSDKGWCMKFRRQTIRKDICTEYQPKVKTRYEQPVHHITLFSGE